MVMENDEMIGKRAFQELTEYICATGETPAQWCRRNRISRSSMYNWYTNGYTPGGQVLAFMAKLGLDVMYILTGERSKTDG